MNFSIIIPAYNADSTIEWAVKSVLKEKNISLECLVIDDCSTDNTSFKVEQINDSRVKLIKREHCSGRPNIPRNDGVTFSTGNIVMFLDADDILPDGYIKSVNELFQRFPQFDVISGARKKIAKNQISTNSVGEKALKVWEIPKSIFWAKNIVTLSGVAIRAPVIKLNKFKNSGALEDWDLWLRLSRMGYLIGICFSLKVGYRRSLNSISPMAYKQFFRAAKFMYSEMSNSRLTKIKHFLVPILLLTYVTIGLIMRAAEI